MTALSRIDDRGLTRIESILAPVDAQLSACYPDTATDDQAVHTVCVSGADAHVGTPDEWGDAALSLLQTHRGAVTELCSDDTMERVAAVLARQPIVDLRIDFEDGYGWRSDASEDRHARAAGRTLHALTSGENRGPRWCGIRPKGLSPHERRRAMRTLELVLDGAGGVPAGFVFTVPKLRAAEQVRAVVVMCEELERAHGLADRSLSFELQIESPQAVIGANGTVTLARAIHEADGRCSGMHYGTYDYSAACGIASQHQSLEHPVADHAKALMLVAAAQTGIRVSDGSTQVVPEGSPAEIDDALARHFRLVTRSLQRGYYQGWDMHPGHLVSRWSAVFRFYRAALGAAAPRLQHYLDGRGRAVVDEPATAQALASVVLRGLACGAFAENDIRRDAPDVTRDVLRRLADRTLTITRPEE